MQYITDIHNVVHMRTWNIVDSIAEKPVLVFGPHRRNTSIQPQGSGSDHNGLFHNVGLHHRLEQDNPEVETEDNHEP